MKHVIAVGSGKGGVGKSTVAVNLALALKAQGHSVGLLDADIYGPSIPIMLGLRGQKPDVEANGRVTPLEAFGMKTMSIGFITEESQAVIWRGPMIHKMLDEFLSRVEWGELDYLVVDLPPGTGDAQLSLSQLIPLTGAVVVTTPQEVALSDVRRAVSMLNKVNIPLLGVVENMSGSPIFGEGGGKKAAEVWKVPFLGAVPLDGSICKSGDEGNPMVVKEPTSLIAKSFFNISNQLTKILPEREAVTIDQVS
ncbi:MAG: Mrp/NBP35 family ATP-binding protein [Deltaproteobacteria bacterium]|nr:Mrp/NBP35 family ATP-binding protein [Deltaproteobacteria bacterium]